MPNLGETGTSRARSTRLWDLRDRKSTLVDFDLR